MKKTLLLNDEPMLQLALGLVLEKVKTELVHVPDEKRLFAALTPDTAAVVIDLGTHGIDVATAANRIHAEAPRAALILFGGGDSPPAVRYTFWTARPYDDREKIAAAVTAANQ